MDLTVNNFFSHLVLKPWDAKDTMSKIISCIASAALALLSLGIVHLVCYLRSSNFSEKKFSLPKGSNIIALDEGIKTCINRIFNGTGLTSDTIPAYKSNSDFVNNSTPIGIGVYNMKPFISIKLRTTLTDSQIDQANITAEEKTKLKTNKTIDRILTLMQTRTLNLQWVQLDVLQPITPNFVDMVINPRGQLVEKAKVLNTLLNKGFATDLNDITWRIA
jgi:hypothetical protein